MKENKCIEMAKSANGNNVSTKNVFSNSGQNEPNTWYWLDKHMTLMRHTHDIDETNTWHWWDKHMTLMRHTHDID